ncbi:hypothetical protein MNV49_007309 [Pseudohyphozyma bogoriensis]|nr:hypothetical protein MNV49_007309 [Pseudohyphozyma bogoriensis]
MVSHSGTCLCGATKAAVEVPESLAQGVVLCHCTDCQHRTGGGFTANVLAPKDKIKFSGSYKEYASKAASGSDVISGFCADCGSSICHHSENLGGNVALHIGNLTGFQDSKVAGELFTKDRLGFLKPFDDAFQKDTA